MEDNISIKQHLIDIEKGNSDAMYNLGYYYQFIEKDYDQMKKYYLMAIEKGDSDAMYNLGCYYNLNCDVFSEYDIKSLKLNVNNCKEYLLKNHKMLKTQDMLYMFNSNIEKTVIAEIFDINIDIVEYIYDKYRKDIYEQLNCTNLLKEINEYIILKYLLD